MAVNDRTLVTTEPEISAPVRRLAQAHGLYLEYVSAFGNTVRATEDQLLRTLASLGVDVSDPEGAYRDRVARVRGERVPPVAVAWDGVGAVSLRLGDASGAIECRLVLEDGTARTWRTDAGALKRKERTGIDGAPETIALLDLNAAGGGSGGGAGALVAGYHELTVKLSDGSEHRVRVISAPVVSFRHEPGRCDHAWGLFCPMYALRSARTMGCGDLTEMERLADWQATLGGTVVSTLPVLASFLDEPYDASPYSPVSRLFWNELFIDPVRCPEFMMSMEARQRMGSQEAMVERMDLEALDKVDYRRANALRRSILAPLAEVFFNSGGADSPEYKAFERENPLLDEYARFRAVTESQRCGWPVWNDERLKRGEFREGDWDPASERYHKFVQFAFDRQFGAFAKKHSSRGGIVYLDLPVGVRTDGFDVFRDQALFALDVSVGAPPDSYFTGGQSWGFPALHPDRLRETRYDYFIGVLRNHMRHADYLRLDHVMAFHRLFWIPVGAPASEGVYVKYAAVEMYAILCLESHRNRCRIVGENLGTVPPYVNESLKRHQMCPLYVVQYEQSPKEISLPEVTAHCVASVNTHDMPTIARSLSGDDIDDRIAFDLFPAEERDGAKAHRERSNEAMAKQLHRMGLMQSATQDAAPVRDALHELLASSEADFVLVNIEDLWLERRWQNVPGTTDEHPNWRFRLAKTTEQIERDAAVRAQLERVNEARRRAKVEG